MVAPGWTILVSLAGRRRREHASESGGHRGIMLQAKLPLARGRLPRGPGLSRPAII
jgi:hypothetical protein